MIGWLDPSIDSTNAGDIIIAQAVESQLRQRLNITELLRLPTQRGWTKEERSSAKECDLFIVGGTNLLSSHPARYRQWRFGLRDAVHLRGKCVLFGVGWWQYQAPPDAWARRLYGALLHPSLEQGVRDSYSVSQLRTVTHRVRNISCPTLWAAQRTGRTQSRFSDVIVTTLTDYSRDHHADAEMLQVLERRANQLMVWPQGEEDRQYISELGFARYCIGPGLASLAQALSGGGVEYVGTRLHGGVRALQLGIPSAIIAVDNRAIEIGSDTGLWVLPREEVDDLDMFLDTRDTWQLTLPDESIEAWLQSLREAVR